ncbi:MAG: cation transporter [Phycisphaerae bacterium]|nr:MAG: efflux RND transporter permease subunit [Planctomycetia bacterium]GJQ28081.1 MAG: cation transporter [Phycisphaerae bacterium]
MIQAIVRFSIQQRIFILILAAVLIGVGVWCASLLPIDAVPDITNKQVQINVAVPALGPEEIERQITFPLEVALAGVPHLKETRSISQFGLSQVTVIFEDDTDLYFARQLVNQRIQEAQEQLPSGVRAEMSPVSTGLGEIYYIKLQGEKHSLMERRTMIDWIVRPQLRTVTGLAEVNTWGGLLRQYQVLMDPQKLLARGLTIRDVVNAVAANNQNAGGAYITRGSEQQLVRSVGVIQTPDDIRNIVVGARGGVPITIGQVAVVTEGGAVRQGAITEDGQGEQVYAITMLLVGENGRIVVERVKDKVRQIQKMLPEGTQLMGFLDRAALINRTLQTALRNLVEGGLLVIVVLFLFLLQLRAGLIVSSMIPLSMLVAIIGMKYYGVSANLMSLGAIDFGMIVDGGVIIVENTVRRLVERRQEHGQAISEPDRLKVIYESAVEVLKPSLYGVIIIIAAYLPILTLVGIEGKMFRPMGLTVIFALLGALVLSFTLIPALCAFFLKASRERENFVLGLIARLYRPALEWHFRHRFLTIGIATALFAFCAWLFPRLGSEFIPELDEGSLAVEAIYAPSISLEQVIERAGLLERTLREKFPDEVKQIVTRIGRPEIATDPMLISQTDVLIDLNPMTSWKRAHGKEELVAQMAEALDEIPGLATSFTQPIKMRMMELIEGVGVRADLGIKLFGPDPEVLAREGARIAQIVSRVQGVADVKVETTQGLPQLQIKIRRPDIARYGINVADVNEIIEAAVGGKNVTVVTDGTQRIDVAVRLIEDYRNDPEKIGRILIPAPKGIQIPLTQLADVESIEGPVQISRENGQRRIVVQANVRGRDLGSFTEEVQRRMDNEFKPPPGYHVEYGGTYEQLQSGRARLALVTPLAFGLVFLLLFTTFGSLKQSAIVFTGIPLSITGGVLSLFLRGMPFSISAGIGFIALAGIAVLNGVVMVTFINQLRQQGLPVRDATIQGALARLRPVLMTASVASIGFIPMAMSHGSGAEVQRPLATVVIGGLITATFLTLVVLPTLYAWFEKDKPMAE